MTDKIAEIRARHEAGAPGEMPIVALAQADADREFLLAEIERLARQRDEARAEVERLRKAAMNDRQLAERVARAMHGEDTWRSWPDKFRRVEIESWIGKIEKIRRVGLELVERGDGR